MTTHPKPPIFYGAALLAALSLIWSGYAITDLMHSGPFGLSVALAGDIGWLTVLWAEARGVTIAGRAWTAAAECVSTFMPSATGVAQAGSGLGAFSTCTRHMRQLAATASLR